MATLLSLGGIAAAWTWFCLLLCAVQLAEMKGRPLLLALLAYLLCPPAALLYYIGVPSREPVEVIQLPPPQPKRRLFERKAYYWARLEKVKLEPVR